MANYYICDGECSCNVDRWGKKNKYCYKNGIDPQCMHTSDPTHAKYKKHDFETGFEETSPNHFFEKVRKDV